MKKFLWGLSTGYLLTSLFSIPSPPEYFWYFAGGSGIIVLMFGTAWWKLNDDLHEGEF
tara:strand:- start:1016 stop:1189 length:174 start_codon:yes stop_codon:yes gene_type:complete